MAKVEDILSQADYTYENANYASKAATGLFKWVKAIRDYYYIFQELQPRRDALMEAEKVLAKAKQELNYQKKETRDITYQLNSLRLHKEEKTNHSNEVTHKLEDLTKRKKRGQQLMKYLV